MTLDEVIDALIENADFEELNSAAKASSYITAGLRYLILCPKVQSEQGGSLQFSPELIKSTIDRAREIVRENATGSAYRGSVVRQLRVAR